MKTYFYILAEYKNQGFVFSKLTDRKEAMNSLTNLNSMLSETDKTEVEALGELKYIETYFISDSSKIINIRGMVYCEGKQVNTYSIYNETEITDFSKLPRINENELFKEENNACDFPF